MTKVQQTDYYREQLGFDLTYRSGKYLRPKCSRCEALVIQGTACHETGCSNARHECHGCNEMIATNQQYCKECR
jgi:hypothetical protein